jgi:acetoin utilization deacetylase AcuC-like enzyme/nucleotide-binding universal stress UspA family protein
MLSHKMGLPLRIFHAIHQPSDQIYPSAEFERGGELKEQHVQCSEAVEHMMSSVTVPWQKEIVFGEPAELAALHCNQHSAAAVVTGSKGFKGVKRLFMGTVVERMARMLPCPLLVVRPDIDASVNVHAVGISCDVGESAKTLVAHGTGLAQRFNARLHLLHAMGAAMDTSMVEPTEGPYDEVQERLRSRLEDHIAAMVPDPARDTIPVTVHIAAGPAKEMLPSLIDALKLDLLMVGVRPRRTLGQWMAGSTTEALLRNSPCHMMVVPEAYFKKRGGILLDDTSSSNGKVTGVVRDDAFLAHRSEGEHPENHRRLVSIYTMLDNDAAAMPLINIEARKASRQDLTLVHSATYVDQIASTADQPFCQLTADTYACEASFEAASRSVGGVLAAIDAVTDGDVRNAFAMVRPPGHHAEFSRATGFCLFNNVALGAAYARTIKGLQRVLIVDWDLHHGNGIQHIFEEDSAVLYISTHQYPCFPGTGHYLEVGRGKGEGYTINLSLGKGWKDGDFTELFQKLVAPVALSFDPDLILVSAGFDTHKKDPLGRMRVTEAGYAAMTRVLMNVAEKCCQDRMVMVLEGGYHVKALSASVRAVLAELCDRTRTDLEKLASKASNRRVEPVLRRTAHLLGHIWPCLKPPANPLKREMGQ